MIRLSFKRKSDATLRWLARPALFFYTLPWLMALLVLGTVSQRYLGLYQSQRIFFGSFILWVGPVPLPGAYTMLGLIAASLTARMALDWPFERRRAGIVLTHASAIILLLGGLASACWRQDGYMVLADGESGSAVSDYEGHELAIYKNGGLILQIPQERLRRGIVIKDAALPFAVLPVRYCRRCTAIPRATGSPRLMDAARQIDLIDAPQSAGGEQGQSGLVFDIKGATSGDGTYISLQGLRDQPEIAMGRDRYALILRPVQRILPFVLKLRHFAKTDYPGTDMASAYSSDVTVGQGRGAWDATISMNRPLRTHGYTLYQSSYVEADGRLMTVLAVVRNAGWSFPYIAIATLCLGLLIHLATRIRSAGALALAGMLLMFTFPAHAAQARLDMTAFGRIPVLQDGRVKPMDSFARVMLETIGGRSALPNETALDWLAQALFDPQAAAARPVFAAQSEGAARLLGLPDRPDRLYSFAEVAAAFAARPELGDRLAARERRDLTADEQDVLRLAEGMADFAQLASSFALFEPLPGADGLDYLDLQKNRAALTARVKATVRRKGETLSAYTPAELRDAEISWRLDAIERMDRDNDLLRVIPPVWEGQRDWLSPWAVLREGRGSPVSLQLFAGWRALRDAYRRGDTAAWRSSALQIQAAGDAAPGVGPRALALETIYDNWRPLDLAALAYALSLAFTLAAAVTASALARRAAWIALGAGCGLQAVAILTRMAILLRPPVSTLYESMVFVGFVVAALSFWLERRRRGLDGLCIGGGVALLLLGAARLFGAGGDTLEVLTAVLNTNFWLGTHVVCITAGYGLTLVAGTLAHLYLLRQGLGAVQPSLLILHRRLHLATIAALLFTATGTMLGGIWADQSWGRFWGWDPKENGALWIVLWLVWMLHGKAGRQVGPSGFAVGMACVNIVVALAWVGVNLLSVGLHSYGFSNAAATSLIVFCGAEAAVIGALTVFATTRRTIYET